MSAGIEGAIDVTDGVGTHLEWLLGEKCNLPDREPVLAVRAAKGVDMAPSPLKTKIDALGGEASPPDHHIGDRQTDPQVSILKASEERNFGDRKSTRLNSSHR